MRKIYCICFIIETLLFCNCSQDEAILSVSSKSTLIYMIADNNLDYYAMENIKKIERGIPDNAQGNIYVLVDRNVGGKPSHPYLLKIIRDTTYNYVVSPILQTYKEQNTCDPSFLNEVIVTVQRYCAEQNSSLNQLILWSHGTGRLPEGTSFYVEQEVVLRSFGLDDAGSDAESDYKKG